MRHEIDVQEAMRRFSADTLDRLYSDILDNIRKTEAHSNRIAINAFSLLLCLHEPLSPDCFLAALTLVDGNHEAVLKLPRVLRICFNLVTVDSNMNVLRFAHISVQEFLEAQSEFSPPQIDGIAATACLHSCLYSSPVGLEAGLSPKEHFYHYGVLYWAEHCKAAFVAGNNPELLGLAKEFMFDDLEISLPFISWLEDAGEYAKVLPRHHWMKKSLSAVGSRNHTPLFTLCVFGLSDMLSQMSQATAFGWNRKNDSGHTALYLACSSGQERIVRVLLDLGADVNPSGGRLGTPLQAACFEGYIDIVRLLIENGADTKSKGAFQNALQASIMGYQEEVAMLLLQNGFKFNDQSEYDEILQGTLQTGFVKGAEYLQRTYGPSFGNMSSAKCKAIRAAISKGQIGVVERFIQKILDPRAELPADSVAVAAVGGHDSMITLLLDKGLDIEHEGQFGKPLRSASLLGHQSTVRLLLDRDAKASARSSMGNALEAAAMNGHVSIASSLLQEGVDANIMGGSYGTALQAAAYRGHSKVAELLLDANADVYLSGLTKDAFHAAAGAGHENVIRLLLDRGYRFRSPMMAALCKGRRPPQYNDPLRSSSPSHQTQNNRHAFRRKKPETPEESSLHSDPRVSFSYKKNFALEEAASNGHLRIVEIILDDLAKHGAVISGGDIGKPLCKASGNGHEEVVKCFLGRNLDGALYLKQALCAAARKGHLGIVDTLTTHIRISLPVDGQTAEVSDFVPDRCQICGATSYLKLANLCQDVAKYCTEVEENILLPGCLGDHVPIVTRALDLMDQRCSTAEVKRIYEIILQESSKHDSCKVMDLAIGIAEFDNADLLMAIALTCEYGSAKALRFLLSKYPRHNPSSGSCETKCLSKVIRLSVGRAQPARVFLETLDYGLYISAFYGHAEVVKTLIQEGASVDVAFEVIPQVNWSFTLNKPDKISQTALQAALSGFETPYKSICAENSGGREAIVLLLLEHGANANQSSRSYGHLLNVAIMHCSGETVQSMIDKGASLMNDHSGRTSAIRNAAHRELGAAAVMKVLLQASGYLVESDPSNSDNSDLISVLDSALGLFSKNGEFRKLASVRDVLYVGPGAVVKMLLQLLPMEKVEDDRYGLLLQMAVSIDDRDWTNFLLARGVNVNGQGYYYGTALQCAARFGNVELVQLLLSSGAEVNILKGEHGTALRAAVKGGHGKVVDVLLQHDADVNLCSPNQGNRSFNPGPVLQLAFESRDIAILKSLIAAGAKLHTECSDRLPLLITACGLGDLAIVRLFLDNEVDVNPPKKRSPDSYRYPDEDVQRISMTNLDSPNRWYYCYRDERASALHMACSKGHKDIARVLLEHRADVQLEVEVLDAKGYYSKTPLQMAAHAGHLSVVQLLIDAGATIDHFNSHGTALSIASGENRLKVVEELLLAKATIFDPLGRWNSLAQACRSRGHAVLELLLDELPESLEAHACTNALSAAASAADDGAFQMLLLRNIPVSSSTLSQACAASLHNSISVLLQHGVDIDGDDGERGRALQVAAYCQTEATVDLLLDRGADVNTSTPKYGSPMQAALEGLAAIFLGAPPEFSTSEAKQVRIKRATYYGYYPNRYTKKLAAYEHIVRALLARGANPNPAPRNYGNPLHLAAFVGHLPIVQQLLAKGADLNSVSDRFGTALLAALEATKWDIAKLLLHTGIEVNHVSSKHGTALHYACKRTNVRMVHLLLDYGADPDRICSSHGSPLTASISGYNRSWEGPDPAKDVAEIILRHGNYVQIAEQDLLFAVRRMATADRYGGDVKGLAYGEEVVRLFLEHDQNLMATESILVAAVAKLGSSGTDTLRLLLQRDGGAGVKESIVEAARNLKIMKVLLNHRPICQVTPEAVYRFSRNFRSADDRYSYPWNSEECEIIRLLLDYEKDMPITSTVLSTVTGTDSERLSSKQTQDLIEYLFERNNQLEVTESVVKEARTADTLKILLKHAPNMKVTPELLSAAAELDVGYRPGTSKRERVLVLLAHDETATVPQSLAKTFPSSDEGDEETLNYLTVLLDRAPDLQLPSDYLYSLLRDRAFGGERTFMKKIKLLVKHNKTFEFTEDIREALEEKENFDPEQKALLYKLQVKGTSVPACG